MRINASREAGSGFAGKKVLILILGLSLTAASCDLLTGNLDFGSSVRGVFKSEDAGSTYVAADKVTAKSSISSLSINSLVMDPTNSDILYAGVGNGIYKSTDAAATWKLILNNLATSSIAIDPFHPEVLYAAGVTGTLGKVIKSTDSGTTWTEAYNEPSKSNTVLSIAVSKASSSTVLAGLLSGEVIRSSDSGKTWQATKNFSDPITRLKFGNNNEAYAMTTHKGLFKSLDFGKNWIEASTLLTSPVYNPSSQNNTTVTIFFDLGLDNTQAGVLYLGTEQGLYRTTNDGTDWSLVLLPVKDAALRVSGVTIDPGNSSNLFASVASTIYKSTNGGLSFETKVLPTSSTVRFIVIDPKSSNIIYLGLRSQ